MKADMMHRTILLLIISCCIPALPAADYLDPAAELRNTRRVSPQQFTPGELPPDVRGEQLRFTAAEESASSAAVPGVYNCAEGIKFEFDFCPDARQSNAFPRILEGPMLSVHLSNPRADREQWEIKALSSTGEGLSQARTKFRFTPGVWVHVTVRADAHRNILSIQIGEDAEVSAPLPPEFKTGTGVHFILGNPNLRKFSKRGFSGGIKNFTVVYPYKPDRATEFQTRGPSEKPLAHAGDEIRYSDISALPKRNFYFPGFAILKDGSFAAVSREGEEHVCPYGRIVFSRSVDAGENWSVPVCLADGAGDERDPALLQLSDGRLLLTWRDAMSWNDGEAAKRYASATSYVKRAGVRLGKSYYRFSSDNGANWNDPFEVPGFSPHGPAFHNGSFYQPTIAVREGKRFIDLLKGSADARQWEKIGTIAESPIADPGTIQEPHLLVLADGAMLCAIRVHSDGYMRLSRSTDQGRTWSTPEKTAVRGFPQHLTQLADGRILATYGYRYYPLGIRGCFSRDGGLTWDVANEVVIRDRGIHEDLGYPVSVQLADGRIASAYYYNSKNKPACHVEMAVWKP